MTVDTALMVGEVLLLIWVVVQGEYIRFYEREVFRMNSERYEERKKWREQKQQQQKRKNETATNVTSKNTESISPPTIESVKPKSGSAESAGDPLPTSISL